jgi:hypothetical protein
MNKIEDDDDVIRDGAVLRVPLLLMDGVQRAVAGEVNIVGHRPGSLPLSDAEREKRKVVYDTYEQDLTSRWKSSPTPAKDATPWRER